jgi:hypothetical protein
MARVAPMKRQRAELGERKKDNYVNSKYIEKNYFLNGSKASPIKTVEQSLIKSKNSLFNMQNYYSKEQYESIDTSGYYGVSVEVADKVKDPFFYERRRQAICYLFEAMGSPEEVVWEDEGIISDLMERLRINRNSRSSVMSILRDVLKSQDLGTSYQPCENNKRRGRPARIVENDDSAKLLYNSLKTGCGLPAAADILNTSRRINGLDYISFSAISSFCSNSTVIEKSTRLTKKSGKSDPNSDWAKARVVQSDQLLKQLGCKPFELGENFRPINLHALVFWDEKHKEQVLILIDN